MAREKRISVDNYAVAAVPRLGWSGWARWFWRQVTSMRVALILLLMLALAAIPGSVLPQWPQDAAATRAFIEGNEFWGPVLDVSGFLDVFGSPWFTAIYLLLFASLIGCIIPRTGAHYRALRAPVSPAPRSLARYAERRTLSVPDAQAAMDAAAAMLRPEPRWWGAVTGYRVRVDHRQGGDGPELALTADKGHVREIGNLLFHVSLVGILMAVAMGSVLMHRGQAIIVEGRSFTNAVVAYDSFEAGALFDPASLSPFTLTFDSLDSRFDTDGRPRSFQANVTLTEPGLAPWSTDIQVNRPLQVDGGKIYLQGNGYAPDFTVRDSDGNIAFAGPVPFLPQDSFYTSDGVVKIPDVTSGPQLGIKATLLPTAIMDIDGPRSVHPDPANPVIFFSVYTGDLGLDRGIPQNVYILDESEMNPVHDAAGDVAIVAIALGDTVDLPDGLGTVTWETLPRFVALDLRADPSLPWLLVFSILSLLGLGLSLFGSRRRLWLVAPAASGTTVVTGAAYAPLYDETLGTRLHQVLDAVATKEQA
ncbi:MAG: cytochrome c biogenesis protein ResB [Actinobacteria bacterium HGW-Actinobacteria-4]|nr:MAG: cytochrome c biogenesis protein ResB [Actinobacteria bacterium HGW-Actinobacteria-4]